MTPEEAKERYIAKTYVEGDSWMLGIIVPSDGIAIIDCELDDCAIDKAALLWGRRLADIINDAIRQERRRG